MVANDQSMNEYYSNLSQINVKLDKMEKSYRSMQIAEHVTKWSYIKNKILESTKI